MSFWNRVFGMWPAVLEHAAVALPWVVGCLLVMGVAYLSPLGRALMRHLRERATDAALSEAMLAELEQLRLTLGEVVERLDSTEGMLELSRRASAPAIDTGLRSDTRDVAARTPH
jgi:hypothetical protein